jgi:hypothetical protein
MPEKIARLLGTVGFATATVLLCFATGASAGYIDWETDGANGLGNPMTNGQAVCTGPGGCVVGGDTVFEFGDGVVSLSTTFTGSGGHNGAATYDSTPGVNASDPDLWVDLGNILILQNNVHPNTTLSGTYGQVFDTPDDERDPADSGSIVLDFDNSVLLESIILVDINGGVNVDLTLTDSNNFKRVYHVPEKWTQDVDVCGGLNPPACLGYHTLDLTVTTPQDGEANATGGDAVVSLEDVGFVPSDVVQLDIHFYSATGTSPISGGIDAIAWAPEPGAGSLLALGMLGLSVLRRR